jgi:DNA repair exonuclease SbcCD ATPase subunit
MRLRSITIEGLRGIEKETVELGPLTAFWGPNGSGKTSVVGSIIYALTGRFPGLLVPGKQSDSVAVVKGLATDPKKGFRVHLKLDDAWVERAISGGKELTVSASASGEHSKGNESAEQTIERLVGDVSWAVDMFDPERSVWRMTAERRKAWALGLCASASGWSRQQLIDAVGPATDDWDPTLHSDAGTCLELNMERTDTRIRSAQKVAREAAIITEGVSSESQASVQAEIARLEPHVERLRAEVERIDRLLSSATTEQAAIERVRRQRATLEAQVKDLRAKIGGLLPPEEPVYPQQAADTVEQVDMDVVALQLEKSDEEDRYRSLSDESAKTLAEVQLAKHYQKMAGTGGRCPFCGTEGAWKNSDEFDLKIRELEKRMEDLNAQCKESTNRQHNVDRQLGAMETTRRQAALLVAMYKEDSAFYADRCKQFDEGFQALLNSAQALETQLGSLPPDRPDIDPLSLEDSAARAQRSLAEATSQLNALRQKLGVATHRQGQLSSQTKAADRVEQLKALLTKMRSVRDRMLDDAVAPLREALQSLDVVCVNGWQWNLVREGTNFEMVMQRGKRHALPVEQLSVGERYLATIALLVAKAMVRREPWSGLFLDNFEAIFPESARCVVLQGLVAVGRMPRSPVDNILVAGACDVPPAIDGVLSYSRGAL